MGLPRRSKPDEQIRQETIRKYKSSTDPERRAYEQEIIREKNKLERQKEALLQGIKDPYNPVGLIENIRVRQLNKIEKRLDDLGIVIKAWIGEKLPDMQQAKDEFLAGHFHEL